MPELDVKKKAQGWMPVHRSVLELRAKKRKPGYVEAVLAVAELHEGVLYVAPDHFNRLAREYALKDNSEPTQPPTKPEPRKQRTQRSKPTPQETVWIRQFFERQGANLFEGARELWQKWTDELEAAGGEACPGCVRNGLEMQYTERVLQRLREY